VRAYSARREYERERLTCVCVCVRVFVCVGGVGSSRHPSTARTMYSVCTGFIAPKTDTYML
jgi:hypothetical protein